MLNDTLANAFSTMLNAERVGKTNFTVYPSSEFMERTFAILKDNGYIKNLLKKETSKGNYLEIDLSGMINKCGVIKPRFAVSKNNYDKYEKRFLPAKNFGILLISTSKGLMTNLEAKKERLGGRLIAYCY